MSPLVVLALLALGGMVFLWVVQSLLLAAHGQPLALPLRVKDASVMVRWPMKGALQAVLLGLVFGFPLVIGDDPIRYHLLKLEPPRVAWLLEAFGLSLSCFVVGTGFEAACGWVEFRRHYGLGKTSRKVLQAFIIPLPLVCVEEALFRGVVLEQILSALPAGTAPAALAVGVSALIFASVHFVRPSKYYGASPGLFCLGCVLGLGYVVGGHTYWIPAGLHAGGVLSIQILRPFLVHKAPAWIVGYRSYPIAGAVGIAVLVLIGAYVLLRFGGLS